LSPSIVSTTDAGLVPLLDLLVQLDPRERHAFFFAAVFFAADFFIAAFFKAGFGLVTTVNDEHGVKRMKGGTLFFLNAGMSTFAVTAAHVVQKYFRDSKCPDVRLNRLRRKEAIAHSPGGSPY
jgi:hypothetical protein